MKRLRNASSCPVCGTLLSQEGDSEGLCPRCLVEHALELGAQGDAAGGALEPETLAFPAEVFAPGQILGGRYRIRGLLGRGGMGEVWRAVDLKLRVEVALKAIRADLLADERALESLRQEVRTAREVHSPNVCRIFDLVELEGRELVSMEYIDGTTLLGLLRERGPLELAEARQIAAQFLAGLEAIHDAGLVHRDVKPENVMITRSGRVVLMDFGIARELADRAGGTIAGTPAYMAPEQGRGETPTARVDVFAAGVVLAEMIAPDGLASSDARLAVWRGLHHQPPDVADSPWAPVIRRAVDRAVERRFGGAAELARALEEVTLRSDRADDLRPFPGLASFGEQDAAYFFGRELEVEELWKKLRRPHLLGLIGPSGAGKSSFLRAGLLSARPGGWRALVTTPGEEPVGNLARSLVPELAGDTEALQRLVHPDDPAGLVDVVRRWRGRHDEVLVVVDQFEELFTLNSPAVQRAFADLLSRLALEADAHVLVSMRDDFLFRCSDLEPLAPMFSELTPLRPPTGTALRRALVQPALKCGYRFEDDSLVDEMVAEVSGERGALPLLAFAASRLWEHRDRERGLLTREAYEHVGGVGGALARHAERTLERIGRDGVPVVRELFRNLVTAEGTRASRSRDELLSVFGETQVEAGRVLDALIDARLLTAYEVPAAADEAPAAQRVEVIHESLLANWPRLERWRAQDADGALLRDQLRQVARLWQERGRPEDLLWTGTSYREYELWRERYGGGLSTAEEHFAQAMTSHAERRRRRRRRIRAAVIASLLLGLGIVATFWRRAERETLRAEANQLLAIGRLELDDNATGALAHAIASLEHADTPGGRRLALDALWQGAAALYLQGTPLPPSDRSDVAAATSIDFSPDGGWLVTGHSGGAVKLWPRSGGEPRIIDVSHEVDRTSIHAAVGPNSDRMVIRSFPSHELEIRSVADGTTVETLPVRGPLDFRIAREAGRVFVFNRQGDATRVSSWPLGGGEPIVHGELGGQIYEWSKYPNPWNVEVDPAGTRLAYAPFARAEAWRDLPPEVYLVDLNRMGDGAPELVGRHDASIGGLTFAPDGGRLASADESGELRIWDLADRSPDRPRRILHHPPGLVRQLRFDATGSRLVAVSFSDHVALWDLDGPPDAGPVIVSRGESVGEAVFDPAGDWLATAGRLSVAIRPFERRVPLELHGHTEEVMDLAFLPDGDRLASVSQDGTLRLWPLRADLRGGGVVFDAGEWLDNLDVGPSGRSALVASVGGSVWLVPFDGTEPRRLGYFDTRGVQVALGDDVAVASGGLGELSNAIRVWNLDTGQVRTIDTGTEPIVDLRMASGHRVIAVDSGGIRVWNLDRESMVTLSENPSYVSVSRDGRLVLAGQQGEDQAAVVYDLDGGPAVRLEGHGACQCGELDAAGTIAVTAPDGKGNCLQVGRVGGGPVHLIAEQGTSHAFFLSPNGRWVAAASGSGSTTIQLFPVPDLSKPPLHTLPYDRLLTKLRSLTNLRVAEDPQSQTGWGWDLAPFPGWEQVPTW